VAEGLPRATGPWRDRYSRTRDARTFMVSAPRTSCQPAGPDPAVRLIPSAFRAVWGARTCGFGAETEVLRLFAEQQNTPCVSFARFAINNPRC
jgi:hypothetical protein